MFRLLLLSSICLVLIIAQEQPNLKLRISRSGLDYANEVASKLLNDQIRTLRIPDIDEGDIKAWDIKILNFVPPAYKYSLTPPSTFTWGLSGAGIEMSGKVRACKRIITKFCITVDMKINANEVNIQMAPKLGHLVEGNPTILDADVQTTIGKLDFRMSGGVLQWIVDLFHKQLAGLVRKLAQNTISDMAKKFLMKDANEKLATFPVHVKVDKFDLDYGLVADPAITNDYIEVALRGKVTQPGVTDVSPYPSTPLASNITENKMVFFWISDKIVNDIGYLAHVSNLTRSKIIDKDTPTIGEYLKLHCKVGEMCLGQIIPSLATMYPDVDAAEMHLSTVTPPLGRIDSNGTVSLAVNATLELRVKLPNQTEETVIFTDIFIEPNLSVKIENMSLVGHAEIGAFQIKVLESRLGPEYKEMLEETLPTIAKPVLENLINKKLATGLQIPLTKGVEFMNPQIRLLERTVQVETDVHYTG
jgi:hypothetical protein